jgi:hypothetical protein
MTKVLGPVLNKPILDHCPWLPESQLPRSLYRTTTTFNDHFRFSFNKNMAVTSGRDNIYDTTASPVSLTYSEQHSDLLQHLQF